MHAAIVCSAMWSPIINRYHKFFWILAVKTMLATCSSAEVAHDQGSNTRLINPLTPVVSKVTWSLHKLMGIYMGDVILGVIL